MLKCFALKLARNVLFGVSKLPASSSGCNLCGRDIYQPVDISKQDWKQILWLAFDLKKTMGSSKECLNIISDKHVTLLFIKPCGRNLLSCSSACQFLGGKSTVYMDHDFESQANYIDIGRALSQITDLIVVNGCNQSILPKLADGSCAPVIGLSTNMFSIIKALSFLMTIQEKYGKLNMIKLAWIGPSSPLCNTILSIFPLFGINVKFFCICADGSGKVSPVFFKNALSACHEGSAEIHQCASAAEAVYRSHVIITSSHTEVDNKVTNELIEEAEFDWILLHPLPRTEIEVSDTVFKHVNNLTWVSSTNHFHVAAALITATLTKYQPLSQMPQFEIP